MSKIRTPPSLKWLIDKRARLLGEITKIELGCQERLDRAENRLKIAEEALVGARRHLHYEQEVADKHVQALKADLQSIDAALGLHEIQINPEIIAPIRTQDEVRHLPYGEITRLIFDYLKSANGESATTTELAVFIATRENLELTDAEFQLFRRKTAHRLRNLHADGKVERLQQVKGAIEKKWALPKNTTLPMPTWHSKAILRHA
jgi:hypothetical protein